MRKASHTGSFIRRRQFLKWLWSVPLVAAALQLVSMMTAFSLPRKKAGSFGTVIDIGPLAEIPGPTDAPRHHSRGKFWLINNDDGLLALSNTCTHLDCLFSWDPDANVFVCPCHGTHFDRTGRVVAGPAPRALDRFPLRIIAADGTISAETDAFGNALTCTELIAESKPAVTADESNNTAGGAPHVLVDTSRKLVVSPLALSVG